MARKPDLPCADCGALMWRGTGVLPEGQATCRECRRKRPGYGQSKKVSSLTSWDCLACGEPCERKPTKGQRPKWCEDCRRRGLRYARTCEHCGCSFAASTKDARTCGRKCQAEVFRKPKSERKAAPARPRRDMRGPLRRGYEDSDSELFFAALVGESDTSGDCWIWRRIDSRGYPAVTWSNMGLHRIVLEVKFGGSLGSQHAHHACANSRCVNPDHLQPVTHRDNIAEMLARRSYMARIRELETALAEIDADHPLLAVIAVA